jgi:hypothetical protein
MQELNIDVTKLDKTAFYKGAKGTYAKMVLFDRPDQYGNDGFVKQDIGKERRQAGENGPIVGNWKDTEKREAPQAGRYENVASVHGGAPDGGDDIPFAEFEKQSPLPL